MDETREDIDRNTSEETDGEREIVRKISTAVRGVYDRLRGRYAIKIAGIVALVLVVLLAGGALAYADVEASVEADAQETLINAADREADGIDSFIRDREADVSRIAAEESVATDAPIEEIRDDLLRQQSVLPESVENIHYYEMHDRRVETSTDPESEGEEVRLTERPWAISPVQLSSADRVRTTEPYEVDGEPHVGFITRVDDDGRHAIVLTVNLAERGALLDSPVEGGVLEIVSTDNGAVTLSQNYNAIGNEYFLLDELPHLNGHVTDTRVDHAAVDHDLIDDDRAVVATAAVEEAPWAVTVAAPESQVYATADDAAQSVALLIALSLVGFIAVGAVISRDIGRSLDEMRGYATAIETGDLDVTIDSSRTDEFGELAVLFTRIRDTLREQLDAVEREAAEADAAREEAQALSDHLERKAADYNEAIDAAADGDLTRRLDTDSRNEAMAEVGASINRMLDDVAALVTAIQTAADRVDDRAAEVEASTEEVESTSMEVARGVEEISEGAERQESHLSTAAAEMNDLSATVEEIASSTDEMATKTGSAAELGGEGRETARTAIDRMEAVEADVSDAVTEMDALRDEVERIGEIVELIDEIAEQTNILALNASIEAARAGEAGSGFAVVAREVKDLAEETTEATAEVERTITSVEESTEAVADDMFAIEDDVEAGRETVHETVETLETIVDRIRDANTGIQSVNDATDEQAQSTQEVVAMVDEVASVGEETAAEASNVSAAAEEQTAAIGQIAESARVLSNESDTLSELAGRFETDEEALDPDEIAGEEIGDVDDIIGDDPGDDSAVADD